MCRYVQWLHLAVPTLSPLSLLDRLIELSLEQCTWSQQSVVYNFRNYGQKSSAVRLFLLVLLKHENLAHKICEHDQNCVKDLKERNATRREIISWSGWEKIDVDIFKSTITPEECNMICSWVGVATAAGRGQKLKTATKLMNVFTARWR